MKTDQASYLPEITLREGWLARDVARAQSKIQRLLDAYNFNETCRLEKELADHLVSAGRRKTQPA